MPLLLYPYPISPTTSYRTQEPGRCLCMIGSRNDPLLIRDIILHISIDLDTKSGHVLTSQKSHHCNGGFLSTHLTLPIALTRQSTVCLYRTTFLTERQSGQTPLTRQESSHRLLQALQGKLSVRQKPWKRPAKISAISTKP